MSMFPAEEASLKDSVCIFETRDRVSPLGIQHLKDVLSTQSIVARILTTSDGRDQLWLANWHAKKGMEIANEIFGDGYPDLRTPEVSPPSVDRITYARTLVSQIAATHETLLAVPSSPLDMSTPPRSCLYQRISTTEIVLLAFESICAAALYATALVSLILLITVIAANERHESENFAVIYLGAMGTMAVISILFRKIRDRRRREEQIRRNAQADAIWADIQQDRKPQQFVLYLRPFESDNRLWELSERSESAIVRTFFPESVRNLEQLISAAMGMTIPLIAIGRKDSTLGPGMITLTDEEWKEGFARLAHLSHRILILPGTSEGALFEVAWIRNRIGFDKLLLFKPRRQKRYEIWWEDVKSIYAELGVVLPSLSNINSFIRISSTSDSAVFERRLRGVSKREIRQAITQNDEYHQSLGTGEDELSYENEFFYISTQRLVLMSILTAGLFGYYWQFRNWVAVKRRLTKPIAPLLRALNGFYIFSLLPAICMDQDEVSDEERHRSRPGMLASAWLLLEILSKQVFWLLLLSPNILCLIPIQRLVNLSISRVSPSRPYDRWSFGQIVLLLVGLLIWCGIAFDSALVKYLDK